MGSGTLLLVIAIADWLIVVDTPPVPEPIQSWDLGPGESAVLTWGYVHPSTEVIVDDLAARRCAVALGIPVRGNAWSGSYSQTTPQLGPTSPATPCGMYLSNRVMMKSALVGNKSSIDNLPKGSTLWLRAVVRGFSSVWKPVGSVGILN